VSICDFERLSLKLGFKSDLSDMVAQI